MNRRPTPETDKAKCKFTSLFGDDEDAYWVPLKVAHRLENERDELKSDLEFRRGLFKLQEEQLNEVRAELDRIREERNQYKGLLIRLYNDLFVHHKGEAVREFKELFREENYN